LFSSRDRRRQRGTFLSTNAAAERTEGAVTVREYYQLIVS